MSGIENPKAHIDSNIVGTFKVLEAARRHSVKHLLIASTRPCTERIPDAIFRN